MNEFVSALGMALGSNDPSKWGGKAPMATCTGCGEPLIPTMLWPGYEFVCVCCGRHLGYVEPVPVESTEQVEARLLELDTAFRTAVDSGVDMATWLRDRVEANR